MKRKLFLQSIPLLIILISSFFVYKIYFEEGTPKTVAPSIDSGLAELNNNKTNLIYDIKYFSEGLKG
jgi:hypothetical protein